jgi:hypothetical protein
MGRRQEAEGRGVNDEWDMPDPIGALMASEGLSFPEAVERLARERGHPAMNNVSPITKVDAARALIREHPERIRQEQAVADAMIGAAAALGRWDELERAVDIKIAEQQEFVTLWGEQVQPPGGDRQSIVAPAETMLSVSEAQKRYGVSKVQVSRWHTQTAPEQIADSLLIVFKWRSATCLRRSPPCELAGPTASGFVT